MKDIILSVLVAVSLTSVITTYEIHKLNFQIKKDVSKYEKELKNLSQQISSLRIRKIKKKDNSKTSHNIEFVLKELIEKVNPRADSNSLAKLFIDTSKTYNVPLEILISVAWQESHFNPSAVSNSGCIGIMQINPRVWKFSKEVLLNPALNINIGAGILRTYYEITGSWKEALIRYYGVSDFATKYYTPGVMKKVIKIKSVMGRYDN